MCESAIAAAERAARLPDKLLPSIARVESGKPDPVTGRVRPWPWAINVQGTGFFYESKAAAIAAVQSFQTRGIQSIDVGCLQVNLKFHPAAFANLDQAFDPQINAAYAARFLVSLHQQFSSWPVATAAYHSQTRELGEEYLRRVLGPAAGPLPASGSSPASPYGTWPPPGVAFGAIPPASFAYQAFGPPMPQLLPSPLARAPVKLRSNRR